MIRTTDIALFTLMIVAAAGTYKIKAEANQNQNEIRRIEKQIAFEEDTIDLLEADWAMLTQPERLQKLAEKYADALSLRPIEARQVVSVNDVPQKGAMPDDDVIAETIAKMEKEKGAAAEDTDETETGSVEE